MHLRTSRGKFLEGNDDLSKQNVFRDRSVSAKYLLGSPTGAERNVKYDNKGIYLKAYNIAC